MRSSPLLSLRATLILAIAGQGLVLLGALGILNAWTIALVLVCGAAGFSPPWRFGGLKPAAPLIVAPLAALALYPPLAFDEMLYHLPFVRAMATSGAISFHPDIRFPIFPQLNEALCV